MFRFIFLIIFFSANVVYGSILKNEGKSVFNFFQRRAEDKEIRRWCTEVQAEFKKLRWNLDPCAGIDWKISGNSVLGRPLVYTELGNLSSKNVTLIFSTIHGDEITPLYIAIQLAHFLRNKNKTLDAKVILAPLVNPDGFFHSPKTRVNARGVDINRNFSTQDWNEKAWMTWKNKYRSDPRRFPGPFSSSEPETLFQENLIASIKPQKILAIHSPLDFLDYVGPSKFSFSQFPIHHAKEGEKLRKEVKAMVGSFFPGSLANYAGRLGIPALTRELPSSDAKKAEVYWSKYEREIQVMIDYVMPHLASLD